MDGVEEVYLPFGFSEVCMMNSNRYLLAPFSEGKTHVVTWIDPPCPLSGNFSRLHTVLYKAKLTDGKAAPRNTIAEYDGKPSNRSILCNTASGKNGMDRPSAGGGRDG